MDCVDEEMRLEVDLGAAEGLLGVAPARVPGAFNLDRG